MHFSRIGIWLDVFANIDPSATQEFVTQKVSFKVKSSVFNLQPLVFLRLLSPVSLSSLQSPVA
jgi:hypothetical protein